MATSEKETTKPPASEEESTVPPPSYDQIVEVDNPTAPTLHQTFPGSIFGTSTVLTLELANNSSPVRSTNYFNHARFRDYSLVIHDFLGSVQAKANVVGLNTTLENLVGTEILQIRSFAEPVNPRNVVAQHLSTIYKKEEEISSLTFEAFQNNVPLGSLKYTKKGYKETSLSIHQGNSQFVVKSLALTDFVIFRDQSSSTPLCNIQLSNARCFYGVGKHEFDIKIIFHPETGITTEEQFLCIAAAIAIRVAKTHFTITSDIHSQRAMTTRLLIVTVATIAVVVLLPILVRTIVSIYFGH